MKIYTNQRDCYENKSDNFTIQKNTGFLKKILATCTLKFTSNQIVKKKKTTENLTNYSLTCHLRTVFVSSVVLPRPKRMCGAEGDHRYSS